MTAQLNEINKILNELLINDIRIDRFDASYLSDIKHILRENHNVIAYNDDSNKPFTRLKSMLPTDTTLDTLADVLRVLGVSDNDFLPHKSSNEDKHSQELDNTQIWNTARDVVADSKTNLELIRILQAQYSMRSVQSQFTSVDEFWGRPVIGDTWGPMIRNLIDNKAIDANEQALTIGPRWTSEVIFFRLALGLVNTIGLDLFSQDKNLVIQGDMHEMPFEDNTFCLIYQRNTFIKAYDLRKTLAECVRTLKDGGVLISDDTLEYKPGVNEVARSSVTDIRWYSLFLKDNIKNILHNKETMVSGNKVAQYAVQIKK